MSDFAPRTYRHHGGRLYEILGIVSQRWAGGSFGVAVYRDPSTADGRTYRMPAGMLDETLPDGRPRFTRVA